MLAQSPNTKQICASFLFAITSLGSKMIHKIPISQFIYLRSMFSFLLGYIAIKSLRIRISFNVTIFASISQGVLNALITTISKDVKLNVIKVNSLIITQYGSFFNMLPGVFCPLILGQQNFKIPDQAETLLIVGIAVGGICSSFLNFQSLRDGKLSIISNLSQSQILFAFLLDFFILKNRIVTASKIFGNVLMLISIFIIANSKN